MKKLILLLGLLFPLVLFGQTKGSIAGIVKDAGIGEPMVGANIILVGTNIGTATDENGKYKIKNLNPGRYSLQASFIGYKKSIKENIVVKAGKVVNVDFQLEAETIQSEAVEVIATQNFVLSSVSSQKVLSRSVGILNEGYPQHNTEEYDFIKENNFKDVIKNPLSTFSVDVDAASYSNVRRVIMQDEIPYKDAVRIEEFINYFDYDYVEPTNGEPLKVNLEYSDCPWNNKHKLIQIGLQSKKLNRAETKASNLVFLIDVSGSMDDPKKLPLLKNAFKMLVEQLQDKDRISIVVYAGNAGLVLPSTPGSNKEKIMNAIDNLEAGGSTAGGAGIQLAYNTAEKNFIKEGNNRVILATDGDFNVGISSTSELVRFVDSQKNKGIFLTVLGFGMGNYKDNRLQELADNGNGNHAYIDNILEAKKVFVDEINATLYTIAKDVKIQVEFNPAKVKSYRLVGYENRMLNEEDFKNDKKDAGEIGAGHRVTALYEIVPADSENQNASNDLKYQETFVKDDAKYSNELLTVRIRYKEPDGDTSKEISAVLNSKPIEFNSTSDNFRLAAAVAEFGMILRESEFKENSNYDQVTRLASSAVGNDKYGYRAEFLNLVKRSKILADKKN